MGIGGRGRYLGADAALDDDYDYCGWCDVLLNDGGYGIEGRVFCDATCAEAWWQEWCEGDERDG